MSSTLDQDVAAFETHRRALTGLAYRMLGSRTEAEDIVQEAYLRWHTADRAAIEKPRRYLGTGVTRLCLDRMKSAQARREVSLGQWLPEPVVDEVFDGEGAVDLAHDISVARRAVFGWRRQTRCSAQPDGGADRIPRFVCRRCPQKPGARGHGGAARHGQRA